MIYGVPGFLDVVLLAPPRRYTVRLRKRDNLTTWEGRGGASEKARPSISIQYSLVHSVQQCFKNGNGFGTRSLLT
jgi:hypothetical protein